MNYLHLNSYKSATWMTVSVSIVGFALLIAGAALTGIAFTEVRPNFADDNYNRFMGAHLQKTVGPVLLAFGALLLVAGCVFLGFVIFANQKTHRYSSKASPGLEDY